MGSIERGSCVGCVDGISSTHIYSGGFVRSDDFCRVGLRDVKKNEGVAAS